MSKSSGTGASGTEQSGRVRTGGRGAVVPSSGTRFSNYDDILNLPKVTFDNYSLIELENFKRDFKLKNISNEEIAAMFGALNNSKIKIEQEGKNKYSVQIENDFLDEHLSVISKDAFGRTYIAGKVFFLKRGQYIDDNGDTVSGILPEFNGKGIGVKSFSRQAFYAAKNGVKYITAFAGKGGTDDMVGYYVWPRLGFNGALTESKQKLAQKHFKDDSIRTVQDILSKPKGESFWFKNGEPISVIFDLSPGSESVKKLNSENIKLKNKFGRIW